MENIEKISVPVLPLQDLISLMLESIPIGVLIGALFMIIGLAVWALIKIIKLAYEH